MATFKEEAKLFRVMMHPARLEILNALQDGEQCVCHLEAVLGYRQSYISQHLITLRQAGLIQDRRDGLNIYYRVANLQIFQVIEAARGFLGRQGLGTPASQGEPAKPCTCPKCQAHQASTIQIPS